MPDTTSVGQIGLDLVVNQSKFNKQLGGLQNIAAKTGKKIATALISGFAIKKLVDFGKKCVEVGSDLSEAQNVVDVTFGAMSDKVNTFAKDAATSFGLSETVAKRMTGTYGAMAKAFGFSQEQAYNMSTALTGLAGDVASFYNLSADEAYTKLKSVFTGETESLKDLGVVMTQTALDSYALANGFGKTTAVMTEAEKVSLRYAFVTKQLSAASGDFLRTSDGWANQMRVLNLQMESIRASIGQGLINALTPALQMLNRLLAKIQQVADAFKALTERFFGHSSMEDSTTAAAAGMEATAEAAEATNQSLKKASRFLAAFDVMNKVSSSSSTAVTGSTGGSGAFSGSQGTNIPPNSEKELSAFERGLQRVLDKAKEVSDFFKQKFSQPIQEALDKLREPAEKFANTLGSAFGDIQTLGAPLQEWFSGPFCDEISSAISLVSTVASGLLDTFSRVFGDIWTIAVFPLMEKLVSDFLPTSSEVFTGLISVLENLFEEAKKIFDKIWEEALSPVIELISQAISDTIDILVKAWEEHGQPIIDELNKAIDGTGETLTLFWDETLKPIVDNIIATASDLWDNHIKPFIEKLVNGIARISLAILKFYNEKLKPVIDLIITKIGPKISAFINKIVSWIGKLAGDIFDILGGIVDFITNVFEGDWEGAWESLKDIVGNVFTAMVDLVRTPINTIIGLINGMIGGVCSGINSVIGALNGLKIDVPQWVTDLTGMSNFGFNIPTVTAPQIPELPALANGGFVRANTPQLAIIGDNRHQGEVVSPEGKLKDMAYQAAIMASGGSAALMQRIIDLLEELISIVKDGADIVLMVDGEELARVTADGAMRLKRRYTTTEIKFT